MRGPTPNPRRRIPVHTLLLLLVACADDSATGPESVAPGALRLDAPAIAIEGVPFEVQVTALEADGGTTLTSFSGVVTFSVSGGTVTPATLTLSGGTGTVQVTLSGASGAVTLRAKAGAAEASANLQVTAADGLLVGAPGSAAAAVIPDCPYIARAGDFRDDHPGLPGLPLSFNTLMVSFVPGTTVAQANELLQALDAEIVGGLPGVAGAASGMLFLRIASTTHEEMEAALGTLRASEHVDVAVQDVLLSTSELPKAGNAAQDWTWASTPGGGNWGMELVRAPQMWNLNDAIEKLLANGNTQKPVTGVLDGGFDSSHEDLSFEANQTPGVTDDHGTHVAGIVGALHDNGKGVEGINPFARLVVRADAVTFSGATIPTVNVSLGAALIWNFDRMVRARPDLRVVNISLGYDWAIDETPLNMNTDTAVHRIATEHGRAFRRMLEGLANSGQTLPVVTIAAGNESDGPHGTQVALYASPMANAALEPPFARNLIVVEALDLDLSYTPGQARRRNSSNPGGHISAPGGAILSTVSAASGNYDTRNGTSMAAPLVAGLVGYLYTLDSSLPAPTLQSNPVLDLLLESAIDVGGGAKDRIDAFDAVLALDKRNSNDRVLRMPIPVKSSTESGGSRPLSPEDVVR